MLLAQSQLMTNNARLTLQTPRFSLRLAQSEQDLHAAQALRFQVFNLELGAGLTTSFRSGRDEDRFDRHCDHLLLFSNLTGQLVGTYRLQTAEMAASGAGFYAATEFELSTVPEKILLQAVELGRACIALEHRNSAALLLLWRGIAAYLALNRKRYLFGCSSTGNDCAHTAWALHNQFGRTGFLHEQINVAPLPAFVCTNDATLKAATPARPPLAIPRLLQSYLRFGAKVCSPPALDHEFGTYDFFTLFDLGQLNERARQLVGVCCGNQSLC